MAFEFDPSSAKLTTPPSGGASGIPGGFDSSTATLESGGTASDLAKSVKVGVQRLPGMVTGLADLPIAAVTGARPFTKAADAVGEATGFQPGKWADETKFSKGYEEGKANVDKAWKEGDAGEIALSYLRNPGYTANQVAESLPGMVAGGVAGRVLMGAGAAASVAADAAAGTAARAAIPGVLARTVGEKLAAPVAAGIGEGAVTAGQQMAQYTGDDQQKNALASLGAGVGTGVLGVGAGRVANKLGLETAETAMAKIGTGAVAEVTQPVGRRVLGGMVSEAVLQELPQSAQEQMWQNYADGKDIWEGVARQAVEGAIAGGVMGVGANLSGASNKRAIEQGQAARQRATDAFESATQLANEASIDNLAGPAVSTVPAAAPATFEDLVNQQQPAPETDPYSAWDRQTQVAAQPTPEAGAAQQPAEQGGPTLDQYTDWEENNQAQAAMLQRPESSAAPTPNYLADVQNAIRSGTQFTTQQTVETVRTAMGDAWLRDNVEAGSNGIQSAEAVGAQLQNSFGQLGEESATAAVDARVRTGRILSGLQNVMDGGAHNTMQVLARLNDSLVRINEAPLQRDEVARVRRMADAYMGFKGAREPSPLPRVPAAPVDAHADNSSMESRIPERPLSVQMGIDRNAGPLSRAAADAVDSGLHASMTARSAAPENTHAQAASAPVAAAAQSIPATGAAAQSVEAARAAPHSQPTGVNLEPQADQAQQAGAQPTQAGEAQTGAAAESIGQGLSDAATPQNDGAQVSPQTAAQGQTSVPAQSVTPARPPNWRTSMLRAGHVARGMGIDTKGKHLPQVLAEIDAADARLQQAAFKTGADAGDVPGERAGADAGANTSMPQAELDGSGLVVDQSGAGQDVAPPEIAPSDADEEHAGMRTGDSVQGSNVDRAVMDMAREGRPSRDILRLIAGTTKNRFYRQVARLLLSTGVTPSVEFQEKSLGGGDGFKFIAKYSRKHDKVTLTPAAQAQAEQIFMHEMIHAATLKALDRKGLASLQMRRLFEHIQKQGGATGQYGMKNVGEFIAEAFSNPEFQRALKSMSAPTGSPLKTAWDAFVRILKRALGLQQNSEDALSRALELGVAVMREDMAIRARGRTTATGDAFAGEASIFTQAKERWSALVDRYVRGQLNPSDTYELLPRSPSVLRMMGLPDLPIRVGEHALEALYNHGVTPSQMKQILDELANPQLVMIWNKGRGGESSLNFLTSMQNGKGEPYVIGLKPNRTGREGQHHWIATVTEKQPGSILGMVRDGGAVYVGGGKISGIEGATLQEAMRFAKEKRGKESRDLKAVMASKDGIPNLVQSVLYSKDLERFKTENATGDTPMFSRSAGMPAMQYDNAAQTAAAERAFGSITKETWMERAKAARHNFGTKLRQGLVDQFAPIKEVSEKGYVLARLSKGTTGAVEAALMYGKPFLRDGVADVDVKDGGFAKVLASLKGEHDRFFQWVAAHRAERLKAEGKENLLTDADIGALKTLNAGHFADGKPRVPAYAAALRELNAFNEASLKIALDSGLIDQAAFDLMKDQPYVPFYRLMEDGDMRGPRFSSGLINQQAFKKLKGGTQQINSDLLANTLMNWSSLYAAAARNRAALETMKSAADMGIAYQVPADTKGAIKVMRDGVAEHWAVEDPYLLDAISAMSYTPNSVIKAMAPFKRLLTFGITVNPTFKIRNLIRDSLSAMAQSDLSYNPLDNVAKGWKATSKESQTYASMLASGGIIRFGSQENTQGVREHIAKLGGTVLDGSNWGKLKGQMKSLWGVYEEFGDRTENLNRAALYERLVAKGHSHAEASFMARDLMDFSMSGKWEVVRFLTQTVPFLNARLQGLYKLGRAAKEDPRRFAVMAGAVSLASLGLMAAYSDDDDWKKREDWDRDNYWWFKIGGHAYRIPKPFEVGSIGTLAERTAELMLSKEMTGKRFGARISDMVFNTFAMDPTPQALKPFLDVYANKDSFSGKAIEGMADERLRPEDRYNERTSEVARLLGSFGLPDPVRLAKGEYSGLSPKQVDFLLRGYFGWLATVTTTATDTAIRPMLDRGDRPALRLRDTFLAGNFVEALPTGSSRYVTAMYEQSRDIEQSWASYQEALKSGDMARAQKIQKEEGPKLQSRMAVNHAKTQMAELSRQAKRVESSKMLTAEQKREQLDVISGRKDEIAKRVAAMTTR